MPTLLLLFPLGFCGGTCLSKAHGLIQRMSEDLDFKVLVPAALSRSARNRKLSQFKKNLITHFSDEGFDRCWRCRQIRRGMCSR